MAAIALLVPALATAQSLQSAPPARTAPVSSSLDDRPPPSPSAPQSAPVSSSLDDRPQSSTSVHKPAKAKPSPANGVDAAGADRRPVKLYDRSGRLIPGAVQVGPNRVLDTRSGRYHSTVPSGDGQRIDD